MKKLFHILILLIPVLSLHAHPGIGIVKDSKGNIYYTDLKQVWKIDLTGNKTIIVSNVHTHELYMDPEDNLFGEHLWYNGEAVDTWGHYTWCLKSNGELVRGEAAEGFLSNYSFTRDKEGNMYWVERFTETRFMKKSSGGQVEEIARGKFGFVGWLHVAKDGSIFFTDRDKLMKLTPEKIFTEISNSMETRTPQFNTGGRNYNSYGIWADERDNIYVAMIASKKILRVKRDGSARVIYYSNSGWTPSSGLFDDKGNLWILEYSIDNRMRARNIGIPKIDLQKPPASKMHIMWTAGTGAAILLFLNIIVSRIKRRKI